MNSLFSACRFGFQRAIELSDGDERAHEGLRVATELMCERALGEGNVDAAGTLLNELANPSPSLKERVEQEQLESKERLERLTQYERSRNTEIGKGKRIAIIALFSALASAGAFYGEAFLRDPSTIVPITGAWQLLLLIAFVGMFRYLSVEDTENNRLVFILVVTCLVSQLIVTCIAGIVGITFVAMNQMYSAVWVTSAVATTLAMGWFYTPTLVAAVVAMLVISRWPSNIYYAISGGTVIMTLNFGVGYVFKSTRNKLIREQSD